MRSQVYFNIGGLEGDGMRVLSRPSLVTELRWCAGEIEFLLIGFAVLDIILCS